LEKIEEKKSIERKRKEKKEPIQPDNPSNLRLKLWDRDNSIEKEKKKVMKGNPQ